MTTIAYRDGVLAADSGTGLGDIMLPERTKKIHRMRDGRLFAWTGDEGDGARLLAHFNNPAKYPLPDKPSGVAVIIDARGRAWTYECGALLRAARAPYLARGTGTNFAYAAMAMGANAKQAVKVAAKFDKSSRIPVQSMSVKR